MDALGRGPSPPAAVLVVRLWHRRGFFSRRAGGTTLGRIAPALDQSPAGVYPLLREDWAFLLGGDEVHERARAGFASVNFAAAVAHLPFLEYERYDRRRGVVVPQTRDGRAERIQRHYRSGAIRLSVQTLAVLGAWSWNAGGRYTGVSG